MGTKGALADAVATKCELKKSVAAKVINELAEIATKEVKKSGIFTVPGLCSIKTRMKPATKAGKREMFGKITIVKAKPAKKIVKAFPSCGPQGQHLNASHAAAVARTSVLRGSAHGIGSALSFGGWLLPLYIPLKHEACHSRQS